MAEEEKKEETETSKSKQDETKTDETEETKEIEETSGEEESEDTEGSEESEEGEKEPSQEDWKKIAQDERDRREKAEKALARDRYKMKHPSKEEESEEEEEMEEGKKPLTASQLETILARERETNRKEALAGETKRIARELAASDDEAEAIVEIFNSHGFPESLSHEEKVKRAFYIAHGPRLTGKIMELRRALRSKETKSKSSAENVHRDAAKGGEPKLAPLDKAEMSRLGFKWDGKRYSKKLASGKLLVKDLKTKKTFVEG